MKKLVVEWKHFDKNGTTCERCFQTGKNLNKAISGLPIVFIETKLPERRMAESNQILIGGRILEELIPGTKTGQNTCGSCADLIGNPGSCHCRTVVHDGDIHETIPVNLIMQAINIQLNNERKPMKIQVLGSGCPTCKKLYEITEKIAKELGLDTSVEYITGSKGMQKIIDMGIMSSPVLAINGKPAMVGFTPDIAKIKNLLVKAKK